MRFTKYSKHGAYHWRQYVKGTKYKTHVDRIIAWVQEDSVLDIGAGDGLITYLLSAVGIDNEPAAIKIAKTLQVDVSLGDIYNLPYSEDMFEAVTLIDVIEHLDEPERALLECRRVAPVLYVATPELGMVNDKFHVKEWTRTELPIFMKENGYDLSGEVLVDPKTKSMYGRFVRVR